MQTKNHIAYRSYETYGDDSGRWISVVNGDYKRPRETAIRAIADRYREDGGHEMLPTVRRLRAEVVELPRMRDETSRYYAEWAE